MPFWVMDTQDTHAQGSMCYMEMHIGATWRIRVNRPRAAAMRLYLSNYFDQLLWLDAEAGGNRGEIVCQLQRFSAASGQ